MEFRAGRHAFARPCEGIHKSKSIMSTSLLLQQCPICLVRLILIVFVIGSRWPYSCCFLGCCLQDLFNIARRINNSSQNTSDEFASFSQRYNFKRITSSSYGFAERMIRWLVLCYINPFRLFNAKSYIYILNTYDL